MVSFFSFFSFFFLAPGGGLPLCPEILQYTQWLCLSSEFSTVRDAGFEPGTTASAVWSATNEPPHLHLMVSCSQQVQENLEDPIILWFRIFCNLLENEFWRSYLGRSTYLIKQGCGSKSRRENFSNKNRKNARNLVKSASLFNFLKVNLHKLHCFLLLSNL